MSFLSQIGSLLGSAGSNTTSNASSSSSAAALAAANAKPFSQTLQQSIDWQNSAASASPDNAAGVNAGASRPACRRFM